MGEKWIDEIEERGEKRGFQKGLTDGIITAYYEDGHNVKDIAEKVKLSVSYVKQVLGLEPAMEEG